MLSDETEDINAEVKHNLALESMTMSTEEKDDLS